MKKSFLKVVLFSAVVVTSASVNATPAGGKNIPPQIQSSLPTWYLSALSVFS